MRTFSAFDSCWSRQVLGVWSGIQGTGLSADTNWCVFKCNFCSSFHTNVFLLTLSFARISKFWKEEQTEQLCFFNKTAWFTGWKINFNFSLIAMGLGQDWVKTTRAVTIRAWLWTCQRNAANMSYAWCWESFSPFNSCWYCQSYWGSGTCQFLAPRNTNDTMLLQFRQQRIHKMTVAANSRNQTINKIFTVVFWFRSLQWSKGILTGQPERCLVKTGLDTQSLHLDPLGMHSQFVIWSAVRIFPSICQLGWDKSWHLNVRDWMCTFLLSKNLSQWCPCFADTFHSTFHWTKKAWSQPTNLKQINTCISNHIRASHSSFRSRNRSSLW